MGRPGRGHVAARLEVRLSSTPPDGFDRVEVINAGVDNCNTAQEVSHYVHRGYALQPHLVLLFYFINDAEPVPRLNENPLVRHSLLAAMLFGRTATVLRSLGMRGGSAVNYYRALYAPRSPGWAAVQRSFSILKAATSRRGAAACVVLLPELHSLEANAELRQLSRTAADAARHAGLDVIDTWPAFEGRAGTELWVSRDDAHPNAVAHQIIADVTAAGLTSGDAVGGRGW